MILTETYKNRLSKLAGINLLTEAFSPDKITKYYNEVVKAEGMKPLPVKFGRVGKGGACTVFDAKTKTALYIMIDLSRVADVEFAVLHEITHQYFLEKEQEPFLNCSKAAKFKKKFNVLNDKYMYSSFSKYLWSEGVNEGVSEGANFGPTYTRNSHIGKTGFYNSYGSSFDMREFYKIEVKERGNYSSEDVKSWMKKYDLTPDSIVAWVTTFKRNAVIYIASDDKDMIEEMNDEELSAYMKTEGLWIFEINADNGFIIPESDDGDYGFVFVITNLNFNQDKEWREIYS
jgi:hypothetical protein